MGSAVSKHPGVVFYRDLAGREPWVAFAAFLLYYARPLLEDAVLPSWLRLRAAANAARRSKVRLYSAMAGGKLDGAGETVLGYAAAALWASVLDALVSAARAALGDALRARYKSYLLRVLLGARRGPARAAAASLPGGWSRGLPAGAAQLARSASLLTSVVPMILMDVYTLVVEGRALLAGGVDWRLAAHPVLAFGLERGLRAVRDALACKIEAQCAAGARPHSKSNAVLGQAGRGAADLAALPCGARAFEQQIAAVYQAHTAGQVSLLGAAHGLMTSLCARSTFASVLELSIVPWVLVSKQLAHDEYAAAVSDINRLLGVARRLWAFTSLLSASPHEDVELRTLLALEPSAAAAAAAGAAAAAEGAVPTVFVGADVAMGHGGGSGAWCLGVAPPGLTLIGGTSYVVTGPNGAGKSTLLQTLAGELEPVGGGVGSVRRRGVGATAYVRQSPVLFAGTVRFNLRLADADASDADMMAALHIAGLVGSGCVGPGGSTEILDVELGEDGAGVSGGQAQSVALARALLIPEISVLLLDEAMSKMDAPKRCVVLPRLLQWVRARHVVLVAVTHAAATAAAFDVHLGIEDGIVHCGH